MGVKEKIIQGITEKGPLSTGEIIAYVGIDQRRSVLHYLGKLTLSGQLIKKGRRPYVVYQLPAKPSPVPPVTPPAPVPAAPIVSAVPEAPGNGWIVIAVLLTLGSLGFSIYECKELFDQVQTYKNEARQNVQKIERLEWQIKQKAQNADGAEPYKSSRQIRELEYKNKRMEDQLADQARLVKQKSQEIADKERQINGLQEKLGAI